MESKGRSGLPRNLAVFASKKKQGISFVNRRGFHFCDKNSVVAGKMRAVGTANTQRWPAIPDVPTFDEQGVKGMTDLQSWFGVMAPAGTPKDIVDKLADRMTRILAEKDVAQKMDLVGMYPAPLVKEQFAEKIRADHERYGKLIARAGIKLE